MRRVFFGVDLIQQKYYKGRKTTNTAAFLKRKEFVRGRRNFFMRKETFACTTLSVKNNIDNLKLSNLKSYRIHPVFI